MAAILWVMKNGALSPTTTSGQKRILAQGNPAGEGAGTGKTSQKVRTSGPVSSGPSSS